MPDSLGKEDIDRDLLYAASIGRVKKKKFRLVSLERPTFNEDCRLVAKVDQPLLLPEAKLEAQHNPLRPFAGLCLFGMEPERRSNGYQTSEISTMDAVAEPDPSLLPTTAVQEVGVKSAEVAGQTLFANRRNELDR